MLQTSPRLTHLLLPGLLHHKGDKTSFSSRFGQGSIIGVHLDTWHGTLTFFKNRKCIGEGDPGEQRGEPLGWGQAVCGLKLSRVDVAEAKLGLAGQR